MGASKKLSRNDLCSCGSGKKYKRCCEGKEDRRESRVTYYAGMTVLVALALGAGAFAITLLDGSAKAADDGRVWSEEHGHFHGADGSELGSGSGSRAPLPATGSGPPPGPPPAGKVWSYEHGHWHDAPAAGASAPSAPLDLPSGELVAPPPPPLPGAATPGLGLGVPGAPGAAPPGKVWSTEHGHWHDAPTGTTPGPSPAGPPPPGKVWSTEHGHWHDAPVAPGAAPAPEPSEEVLWSTGE